MWLLLCSWQLSSPLGSELKNNILRQRLAASSLHVLGAGSLPPAPALTPPGRTHREPPAPFGQQKVFFSCKTPGKSCPTPRALLQARAPRGFASLAGSQEEFPSVQQPQSNPPPCHALKMSRLPLALPSVASCFVPSGFLPPCTKPPFHCLSWKPLPCFPESSHHKRRPHAHPPGENEVRGSWKRPREGLGELLRLFLGSVSPPARLPSPPTAWRVVLPLPLAAPIPGSCIGAAVTADFPGGCRGCWQPGGDGEQGGEQSRGCSDPASSPPAAGTACASEGGRREEQRTGSAGWRTNKSGWNLPGGES